MNLITGFKLFWQRTFDFSGKTTRKEFWFGVLANAIIMLMLLALLIISLTCLPKVLNAFSIAMLSLFSLFCLVELLPSIALIIRRMHDVGLSGFYIFVLFLPVVGFIWYLYLVTRPSNYYFEN